MFLGQTQRRSVNPMQRIKSNCKNQRANRRDGAAAVEFAIIFPLFLMLMLGTVEFGKALDASVTLHAAVREAGRLASMDIHDFVAPGEDPNDKVIDDIRNFLYASGIDGSKVTITITEPNVATTFDLSDPANQLELFQINASILYTDVSIFPMNFLGSTTLRASIVFRLGRSSLTS